MSFYNPLLMLLFSHIFNYSKEILLFLNSKIEVKGKYFLLIILLFKFFSIL